jgi:hypothetical protein
MESTDSSFRLLSIQQGHEGCGQEGVWGQWVPRPTAKHGVTRTSQAPVPCKQLFT